MSTHHLPVSRADTVLLDLEALQYARAHSHMALMDTFRTARQPNVARHQWWPNRHLSVVRRYKTNTDLQHKILVDKKSNNLTEIEHLHGMIQARTAVASISWKILVATVHHAPARGKTRKVPFNMVHGEDVLGNQT